MSNRFIDVVEVMKVYGCFNIDMRIISVRAGPNPNRARKTRFTAHTIDFNLSLPVMTSSRLKNRIPIGMKRPKDFYYIAIKIIDVENITKF